jgi:hypothetical protein
LDFGRRFGRISVDKAALFNGIFGGFFSPSGGYTNAHFYRGTTAFFRVFPYSVLTTALHISNEPYKVVHFLRNFLFYVSGNQEMLKKIIF